MAVYTWPGSLPQTVLASGYGETHGVKLLRTPTDKGPAKMRRLGRAPTPINVSMMLTAAQVDTLETFVQTTLRGTARFNFPHPRTRAVVEVRIVPTGEGDLYQLQPVGSGNWTLTMTLEILP